MARSTLKQKIDQLRPFSVVPERTAQSRGEQFPTASGRIMALELELDRMRIAFGEAISLLDLLSLREANPEDLRVWPCGRYEVYFEDERLNGFHTEEAARTCAEHYDGAVVFDRAQRFSYGPEVKLERLGMEYRELTDSEAAAEEATWD